MIDLDLVPNLILILILILVNAFFASAEMAIISVNKSKLKTLVAEGNKKAEKVLAFAEQPTKFLSTIQVGITLSGFFSSATAANSLSKYLSAYLMEFNIPYADTIALVLLTILLSFLTLVFGELYPKRVALQKAEALSLRFVGMISVVQKGTAPFVKLLSIVTNALLRVTGFRVDGIDEEISREEMRSLIAAGEETGVLNEIERDMIDGVFDFDEKVAESIMTPRTEVFTIDISDNISDNIDQLLEEQYSRIPVYEDDVDNIIGILYLKDFFLEARKHGFENVDLRSILHPASFIFERKRIDQLFKEMQTNKIHMAIVIDEYGGFSGIITIEDLIEEIMGEIEDEYDEEEIAIQQTGENSYLVDGLTSIYDLNRELDLGLDEQSKQYETISGLMIYLLGYIPKDGEHPTVEYQNLIMRAEKVESNRIERVRIIKSVTSSSNEE